jgi:hypothetical protein
MTKFDIREKVKVVTRYLGKYEYFQLPDECLFFGDSYLDKSCYVILWHGTTHQIPKQDVYKLDNPITATQKNNTVSS